MHLVYLISAILLAGSCLLASPINEFEDRSLPSSICKEVVIIVDVLKLYKATPFCSSFLSISTATITSVTTATATKQITTGTASTSYVFLPGNPPSKERRSEELDSPQVEQRGHNGLPPYISAFASSAISQACSCLSLPTPTMTAVVTNTVTVTHAVSAPVQVSTIYPCADPLPSPGPAYGDAVSPLPPTIPSTENNLYYLTTTEGSSAQACCNTCFFEIENCVQAFWYSYEGCVVMQGTGVKGTGQGVSKTCPQGVIAGLTYGPDVNPAFRSTGNIVGPCGVAYDNA